MSPPGTEAIDDVFQSSAPLASRSTAAQAGPAELSTTAPCCRPPQSRSTDQASVLSVAPLALDAVFVSGTPKNSPRCGTVNVGLSSNPPGPEHGREGHR